MANYELIANDFRLELTSYGRVVAKRSDGANRALQAETRLVDCYQAGDVSSFQQADGRIVFIRQLVHEPSGARCILRESFAANGDSIRWEIEVRGQGDFWTTPIETVVNWSEPHDSSLWTSWGNNVPIDWSMSPFKEFRDNLLNNRMIEPVYPWIDPLLPIPFRDLSLAYGGIDKERRRLGFMSDDAFSVPIVSVFDAANDAGFSIVQSPEDLLLDLYLITTADGQIRFSRRNHRIGLPTHPVRFTIDLVKHQADCRDALGWMVKRYPQYFEPTVPSVYELDGGGAYSTYEGDFDVDLYRRMNFRVNWKASYDFPYMGMFLPPVDEKDSWINHNGEVTSIGRLANYSRRMRALGFYVLGYFNVTEFGRDIVFPRPPRKAATTGDLWKDGNDYLHDVLESAVFYDAHGVPDEPILSWLGCVVMDCGDPVYQNFLIEQAKRHVELLPENSGISIDRMDWTQLYNTRRDDHVSWVDGKPVFAGVVGWKMLLDQIGPIMHDAGKVIYANPMNRRLELLKQIDGIWDEHGQHAHSLNLCAFLSLLKPHVTWTWQMNEFSDGPDAYIQRHLHLGAQLMVPFPGNDHSVELDDFTRQCYLDYGMLFAALHGKRWVLRPHPVILDHDRAKANVFHVAGEAYVIPITFGFGLAQVSLSVGNLAKPLERNRVRVEIIHPGDTCWQPILNLAESGERLQFEVPLVRGCVLVRLFPGG